jgi:chemotaxis-related protein WspD
VSGLPQRPLDDETLDLATEHYARPREDEEKFTGSVLVFRVGSEWLALPTALFDRVTHLQAVHALPHRRAGMSAGLVTVGGDLVVHLSLAALLGIDAEGVVPTVAGVRQREVVGRLIVLANERGRLATTVDDVWGVYHYRETQLRPVPSTLARALVSYTTSMLDVEGRAVGCLDGARVMAALSGALS